MNQHRSILKIAKIRLKNIITEMESLCGFRNGYMY